MVTGCNGSQIPLHAWIDGCLLLTDNASPGSSDGMMPGFLVEEGRGHLVLYSSHSFTQALLFYVAKKNLSYLSPHVLECILQR